LVRPSGRVFDRCLVGWFVVFYVVNATRGGVAWHFFVQGQQALGDVDDHVTGGLHLYAGLPQLQIGPLALIFAWLFSLFGAQPALILAQLFGAIAGVAILLVVKEIGREARPDLTSEQIAWRTRWAAVFFIPVWLELAVASAHLDDALALLFGVLGTYAAVRQRAVLAGLGLGLAVDAKPWALPFAVLLLVLTGAKARAIGLAVLAATIGVCWLPFLIADHNTLNAARFTIPNTNRSTLRVLGVSTPRTPAWDRPAQSGLGLLFAAMAVWRGRWPAAILMAVTVRLVLDPGTNIYYLGGVVVGAALWDIAGSNWDFPWWTALATCILYLARHVPLPPSADGWLILCYFLACALFVVCFGPKSSTQLKYPAVQSAP
jgi:hypothetical protein